MGVKINKILNSKYFNELANDKGIDSYDLANGSNWTYLQLFTTILDNVKENMIMGGNPDWVHVDTVNLALTICDDNNYYRKPIDYIIKKAIENIKNELQERQ